MQGRAKTRTVMPSIGPECAFLHPTPGVDVLPENEVLSVLFHSAKNLMDGEDVRLAELKSLFFHDSGKHRCKGVMNASPSPIPA